MTPNTQQAGASRRAAGAGKTPGNPRGLRDLPFAVPEVTAAQKRRARRLLRMLQEHYPDAHCELDYRNPLELLIATILSAQATDVGVNQATPALFARFRTAADYAAVKPEELYPFIKSIGLYRNKAKSIVAAAAAIENEHGGQVPDNMHDLLALRGVARKTANVVLGNAFGQNQGFVVDAHIERLAKRFGLAPEDAAPAAVERWLCAQFPRDKWTELSHQLIWHGRRVCKARGGKCAEHPICQAFCSTREDRAQSRGGAEKIKRIAGAE